MSNERMSSAAVHVPDIGDLVLGGVNSMGDLRSAEILQTIILGGNPVLVWHEIAPMNEPKIEPMALYHDEAVFAKGFNGNTEILRITSHLIGQWTLIAFDNLPTQWHPHSMCDYRGRLYICSVFYYLHYQYCLILYLITLIFLNF